MGRRTWWATVCKAAKSQTQLTINTRWNGVKPQTCLIAHRVQMAEGALWTSEGVKELPLSFSSSNPGQ